MLLSLYKKDKKEVEKKDKNKYWVYVLYLLKRLNRLIVWFSILTNALFIIFMIVDFNFGVVLFIFNQYIIINYLYRLRKEERDKRK
jgi:hypothetical protein